jgi:biopolymer transport protein ExbD
MNFRRGHAREEPEINLIPFIDVLLVILIFLMMTTTYSRFSELQINLPEATADKASERPNIVNVAVDANNKYAINNAPAPYENAQAFGQQLKRAAGDVKDPVVAISADAAASHQSVINIMESARMVGMTQISFTTQAARSGR